MSDGRSIITSDGLKPGDLIVSAGIHYIENGEIVKPQALENQLIMELAVLDYLQVQLLKLLTNTGESLSEITKPVAR